MNLAKMNKIKIIDCDKIFMFSNILRSIMNNKEAYLLSSIKPLINASTYEFIQSFEIPVSEFYKIRSKFSELAMINNRHLC